MNSVSEKIDERILRLLSLEDVFDIDYDTYYTLIREAMVLGVNKLPQEELAILANERKRVKGKKGRFKPKKEKITADKVATTKLLKGTKKTSALSSAISKPDIQQQDLTGIGKPLESISKTLAALLKFSKKTNEEERRNKESQKRTKREEGLEGFKKGISAVSGAAKKMLAPFQSIIDRIWKFIFFTLLGRAFTQLMDWLGNPANKKKIDVLGRFLKDWWPSLAFAAGLFLTPFGSFVRGTIGLLRAFIPQMARFMLAHPVLFATGGAAIAGGVAGASLEKSLKKVDETLLQRRIQESRDQGKPLSKQEIDRIKLEQLQKRVQDVSGTAIPGSALASGGIVPRFSMGGINFGTGYDGIDRNTGDSVSGFGPDTQAIIAQPGEIVINKKTVDAVGSDHFLTLNRQYGGPGANKPKMGRLYNGGGEVERFQNGGIVGGIQNFIGGIGNLFTGQKAKATQSPIRTLKPTKIPDYQLPEAKALLKSIKTAEHYKGTKDPYNVLYGGGSAPITQMTVKEVIDMYASRKLPKRLGGTAVKYGSGSGAAGAYQFMPFTLEDLIRRGEVKPHQMMTSDLQDKLGWTLAKNRGVNIQSLKKSGLSQSVLDKIAPEWASLSYSGAGGASFYGQPVKGADFLRQIYQQSLPQKKQSGGLIKENTGLNLTGKLLSKMGSSADRQMIAAQPGEFVIPVDTVNRLGTSFFEKLVAMTDSNSNAARLGKGNINRPKITPLNRGQNGMMILPPITQSASGGGGGGSAAGSKVSVFSASSPSGEAERSMNAYVYGIG